MSRKKGMCVDCGQPITEGSKRCHHCAAVVMYGDKVALVEAHRKAVPCATLQEIATPLGLSRERVRQILARDKMVTRHYIRKPQMYECLNCGTPTPNKSGLCSHACRIEYHLVPIACDECHKIFYISQTQLFHRLHHPLNRGHLYCGRICHGKVLGRQHGFGVNPAHARTRKDTTKYTDTLPKLQRLMNQGQAFAFAATSLGIPSGSRGMIKGLLERANATTNN